MATLDQLGTRHRKLLAALAEVRAALSEAIPAERAKGATYVDLMNRSGYTSIETIRQIVDPKARDKANKVRRSATVDQ